MILFVKYVEQWEALSRALAKCFCLGKSLSYSFQIGTSVKLFYAHKDIYRLNKVRRNYCAV